MFRYLFGEHVILEVQVTVKEAALKAADGIFRLCVMYETVLEILRKKKCTCDSLSG